MKCAELISLLMALCVCGQARAQAIAAADVAPQTASFERLLIARSGFVVVTSGHAYTINDGVRDGPTRSVQPVLRISVALRPAWHAEVENQTETLRQLSDSLQPGQRIAQVASIATLPIEAHLRIEHDDLYLSERTDQGVTWTMGTSTGRFDEITIILNCDASERIRSALLVRNTQRLALNVSAPVRIPIGPLLTETGPRVAQVPGSGMTQGSGLLVLHLDRLSAFDFEYSGPFWPEGALKVETHD